MDCERIDQIGFYFVHRLNRRVGLLTEGAIEQGQDRRDDILAHRLDEQ
jgi:hypothetical protein